MFALAVKSKAIIPFHQIPHVRNFAARAATGGNHIDTLATFIYGQNQNAIASPLPESGREWTIHDARRKDFKDLHCLWFVLQVERNMLLTRKEYFDTRNMALPDEDKLRRDKVKKSMQSIRMALDERMDAWKGAVKLFEMKMSGVNVWEKVREIEREDELLKMKIDLKKKGKYLPPSAIKYLRSHVKLEKKPVQRAKCIDYGDVLDMTPKEDRRHRTRRRVGKFRLTARNPDGSYNKD
ncbi:hypothetical protein MP638_001580 [Amoeboaphelidium occidentale]|nr:hypothetical protein MP638_001580 [Amoeboaphelidium occidentale]